MNRKKSISPLEALTVTEITLRYTDAYYIAMDNKAKVGLGQWLKKIIAEQRHTTGKYMNRYLIIYLLDGSFKVKSIQAETIMAALKVFTRKGKVEEKGKIGSEHFYDEVYAITLAR